MDQEALADAQHRRFWCPFGIRKLHTDFGILWKLVSFIDARHAVHHDNVQPNGFQLSLNFSLVTKP